MSKAGRIEWLLGDQISEAAGKRTAVKPKLVPIRNRGTEPQETKLGEIVDLPIEQLVIQRQARRDFDETELRELGESVLSVGLIAPIVVRPLPDQRLQLVAGERRVRAAKLVGLKSLPGRIIHLTDAEYSLVQIAENFHRKRLNPIEQANAFQQAIASNELSISEFADKLGVA